MDRELYHKIARPTNSCVACGTPIADSGKHPSTLIVGTSAVLAPPSGPIVVEGAEGPASEGEAKPGKSAGASAEDEPGPLRRDYCAACWEKEQARRSLVGGQRGAGAAGAGAAGDDEEFVGFWMARREPPKPRRVRNSKERNAALLAYLDLILSEREGDDAPLPRAGHAFVVAHLLMKYGALKWARSEPRKPTAPLREEASPDSSAVVQAAERIVFRNPASNDMVLIDSVTLSDDEVTAIHREVDEVLGRVGSSVAQ